MNELNIALSTGLTVTAQPYTSGAASGSPISLTEVGTTGFYTGDMTGSEATYQLVFLSGGATVGTGQIVWSGTAEVPVSTFNPATDTVARVTLTDTATTLTNSPDVPTESEIATAVWGAATKEITGGTVDTLTNAPTVPSASAIADEVRVELAAELANLDASVSSRLADADYTAPTSAPTAAAVASAVRTELTELSNLDATISSRLADADYTTPPTAAQIATAVEGSLLNEADGSAVLNAIVGAIGNSNVDEIALVAAIRSDLERNGGKIDSIPTDAAPSAASVATAVWSASTKEITGGTVTTLTNSPDVPTESEIAAQVRTELSVELGRIDAAISSRLAPSGTLATVTNLTNAPASVTPSDIWSHSSRTITGGTVDTLTNAPTVPSAASIRAEIDSNSTQLAAIKSKTDALPVSPAATGDIPTADITAIKGKTDLLETTRLAQCSTVATTGAQLAAALS